MDRVPTQESGSGLSRRTLIKGATVGALAAGVGSQTALADGHAAPNAIKHGFTVGEFEVATLLAGTRAVESPQNIFGMNVSADEFDAVSAANFLPSDIAQFLASTPPGSPHRLLRPASNHRMSRLWC